ncbi:unnamed protein product, partial [Prorocentrum cordatum]
PARPGIWWFAIGAGIGAFNSEQLKPCMHKTGTKAHTKALPAIQEVSKQVTIQGQRRAGGGCRWRTGEGLPGAAWRLFEALSPMCIYQEKLANARGR